MGTSLRRALSLCLCLLCAERAIAGVAIRIEGVEGELETAVRNSLGLQHYVDREVSPQQIERLLLNVDQEATLALQPYGYYAPRVESHVERKENAYEVVVKVTPGQPVTVAELQLDVQGS